LLAGPAARIEAAAPLPFGSRARVSDTLADRADIHVTVIDAPAFLREVMNAAAGEGGHRNALAEAIIAIVVADDLHAAVMDR
jgi:hypothetical protein